MIVASSSLEKTRALEICLDEQRERAAGARRGRQAAAALDCRPTSVWNERASVRESQANRPPCPRGFQSRFSSVRTVKRVFSRRPTATLRPP